MRGNAMAEETSIVSLIKPIDKQSNTVKTTLLDNVSPLTVESKQPDSIIVDASKLNTIYNITPIKDLDISQEVDIKLTLSSRLSMDSQASFKQPSASFLAVLLNAIKSLIGSGILTLPWAFAKGSLYPSIMITIICGIFSCTTSIFVIHACDITQLFEISSLLNAISPIWEKIGFFVIIYIALSSCLGYSILIGDSISDALSHLGVQQFTFDRQLYIALFTLFIFYPLSLLHLKYLKWSSFLGILAIFYCFGLLASHSVEDAMGSSKHTVEYFQFSIQLFVVFSICGKAFVLQYVLPPLYKSLKNRSVKKMSTIIIIAYTIVTLLYVSFGVCGYYLYGTHVHADVIRSFTGGKETAIARLAMVISLGGTYPILLKAAVSTIEDKIFHPRSSSYNFKSITWLQPVIITVLVLCLLIISLVVSDIGPVSNIEGALSLFVGTLPIFIIWNLGFASQVKQKSESPIENPYENVDIITILSTLKNRFSPKCIQHQYINNNKQSKPAKEISSINDTEQPLMPIKIRKCKQDVHVQDQNWVTRKTELSTKTKAILLLMMLFGIITCLLGVIDTFLCTHI